MRSRAEPWVVLLLAGVVATVIATASTTPDVLRDVAYIALQSRTVIAGRLRCCATARAD